MAYVLGNASLGKLVGVHPRITKVVTRAIEITDQDFMVVEGLRSLERQRHLVSKGASKTMNSMHLRQADGWGHAVDLVPYDDGPRWEWPLVWGVANAVRLAAIEMGVRMVWGSVWDRALNDLAPNLPEAVDAYKVRHRGADFLDGPHFQLSS